MHSPFKFFHTTDAKTKFEDGFRGKWISRRPYQQNNRAVNFLNEDEELAINCWPKHQNFIELMELFAYHCSLLPGIATINQREYVN